MQHKINPFIFEFDATGTHWWVTVFDNLDIKLQAEILNIVKNFEEDYSRFKESSLVTKLNRIKILSSPSEEFINLLSLALKFYKNSSGIFNISVGSQLEKLGYGSIIKTKGTISYNLEKDLVIDSKKIQLLNDISIDLGGIGKGFLIDKIVNYLKQNIKSDFIVNGGGDLYVRSKKPLRIELEHPLNSNQSIGYINLKNCALAVSSPIKRQWRNSKTNVKHHHIIDPGSGNSKSNFICSYIIAKDATTADVLGTVFLLADKEQRRKFQQKFECEYLLINDNLTSIISNNFDADLY